MAESLREKKFIYRNKVIWSGQKKGILSSPDKPDLEVATPAEFNGHKGIWSPEDLFVSAVNSCIMTTFLYYAQRNNLDFAGFESEAEGVLEMLGGRLAFSKIVVKPKILINNVDDIGKTEKFITLSERSCLISNSIKTKVEVAADISLA